jgi:uncharacterized protein
MPVFLSIIIVSIGCTSANAIAEPQIDDRPTVITASQSTVSADKPFISHEKCRQAKPCHTNRLINQQSPYLLQHAHNPIDWYTWTDEALKKARKENKPIFLSIGYAACYWCHVMEKESFSNKDVAAILNERFISIKVDRETRPDIDEFYGNAVMLMTGQLGWPMTVFLTPDAKPFYGGAYYTKKDLIVLLENVSENWQRQPEVITKKADAIIISIKGISSANNTAQNIGANERSHAVKSLLSIVDDFNGGFGEVNKFPREPWLALLLDSSLKGDYKDEAWNALQLTLRKMAYGGIFDQLGGGFHRYTTDPYWNEPHFEKMLYNQAQLIRVYSKAHSIQAEPLYKRISEKTISFLLSNLQHTAGGFYSSIDAKSDNVEGKYYSWDYAELKSALTEDELEIVVEIYGIGKYGESTNYDSVLYISTPIEDYATQHKISTRQLDDALKSVHKKLLSIRSMRIKPSIDKKIIMGWNGLAITALAEASLYLNNPDYLSSAIKAANFIWDNLRVDDSFYRISYNGHSHEMAQLNDYAFYIEGLISLYDTDRNKLWLDRAVVVTDMMLRLFWDNNNEGFYNVVANQKDPLPVRTKTAFDKAVPSGNAVAAHMLIRLASRTGVSDYREKATQTLAAFSSDIVEVPSAYSRLLIVSDELLSGERDVPIYTTHGHIRIDAMLKTNGSGKTDLLIDMEINDEWHINSSEPLDSKIIPLDVSLLASSSAKISDIKYPRHEIINLAFTQHPIAVYQGEQFISAKLDNFQSAINAAVILKFQACNDKVCLPPEERLIHPRIINAYQ